MNAVGGREQVRNVRVGARLWALDGTRTVQTTVTGVVAVKAREVVEVTTEHSTFATAPDQLLRSPDGWVHARDAGGTVLAWTHARKLCRERLTIRPGYDLGYVIGATCSDGTVGTNYVSLVVNDEAFATKFAESLADAVGLTARLEPVTRPSGYLKREVPGFRVRVVSSYLADLMRQYMGGDAHHMRQQFPRVVLRVPFLATLARIVGARLTPRADGTAARLVVADSWPSRGTFRPERHRLELVESTWSEVRGVRARIAGDSNRAPGFW
ncbi:hypothetical protein [Streptomyces scopuliridis]|uniref:hypothetical protein n=1 Tax=Streptomyces scopuliridis TaxID=452529 RepID=UPI003693F75E